MQRADLNSKGAYFMNTLFDLDNPPLKSGFVFPQLSDDLCRQAFYWTSFDPDKRGEVFKNEYNAAQEIFINFVKAHNITEEQQQDCINYWSNRLYKNAVDYLNAHSRCLSWAITGPAKFPVKKAEKAQNSAEQKLDAYCYTLEQMKSEKIFERYLTAEQKQNIIDAQKWREIKFVLDDFIKYKTLGLTLNPQEWTYNAFPHLKGQFTTQAKNGNYAICEKVLNILKEEESKGLKMAQNIKILSSILEDYKTKQPEETKETELEGLKIIENTEENRLQLIFDGKPSAEIINLLKHNAFKWSPRFKAWQRVLTPNAKYVLKKILPQLKGE